MEASDLRLIPALTHACTAGENSNETQESWSPLFIHCVGFDGYDWSVESSNDGGAEIGGRSTEEESDFRLPYWLCVSHYL
jgi:hypothetical protein